MAELMGSVSRVLPSPLAPKRVTIKTASDFGFATLCAKDVCGRAARAVIPVPAACRKRRRSLVMACQCSASGLACGLEDFSCRNHRIGVDGNGVFHIKRISACIRDHNRNLTSFGDAKNQFIPSLEAFERKLQSAQLIFAIGIGARDITNQIWLELAQT